MIFHKTRSSMRECLILILLITAFLPFHLVYSTVLQQETISTVDQESIPVEKFQERIRFDRWYSALFFHSLYEQGNLDWQQMPDVYAEALDILQHPQVHGERVLDLMERELIIKHAADTRGITVEPSLVEGSLSKDLAPLSNIESVDEFFQEAGEDVSVSRETINEVYFYRALWQLVFDDVTASVPTEESQLHVRHILLAFNPGDPYDYNSISDQQRTDALVRAKDILGLLQNGTSFADLALSSSDDKLSAPNGGDIPWAGEDGFPPSFWEAIKDAPVGSIVGPIESQFGYHIVEILDRGFHPVQPQVLTQRRQELFTQWMESETSKARIERVPDWEQYIPSSPTFEDLLSDIIPQDSPVAQNQIAPDMGNTGTRRIGCGYRVRWMI